MKLFNLNKQFFSALVCCPLLCLSCTTKQSPIELSEIILQRDTLLTDFGDSLYLSQVNGMAYSQGHIYISDKKAGVFALDENYHSYPIAEKGKGRNEVVESMTLYADSDNALYAYDAGAKQYKKYQNGKQIDSFEMPAHFRKAIASQFAVQNDTIYLAVIKNEKLVIGSYRGQVIAQLCQQTEKYDVPQMPFHSERHVIKGDNSLIVPAMGLPIIQEIALDRTLQKVFDLNDIALMKDIFEKTKSTIPNQYFVVVRAACYKNGLLYLLIATKDPDQVVNTILVLKDDKEAFVPLYTFKLQDRYYEWIDITDDNKLVTANIIKSGIEVFKLP